MGLSHVCPVMSPYPCHTHSQRALAPTLPTWSILEACVYLFVHSMLYTVAMQQCGGRAAPYHFLPLDRALHIMYHTAEMHLLLPLTECKTPDPVLLQPGKCSSRQKHWFLKVRCD